MKGGLAPGVVVAVSLSAVHQFSKPVQESIRLLVGLGVIEAKETRLAA